MQNSLNDFKDFLDVAATKDCRLTHGMNLDHKKTFLEINFLRSIHPEIILKEFN